MIFDINIYVSFKYLLFKMNFDVLNATSLNYLHVHAFTMYGMFAYKCNKLNVQSYIYNRKCTKKNNFIT